MANSYATRCSLVNYRKHTTLYSRSQTVPSKYRVNDWRCFELTSEMMQEMVSGVTPNQREERRPRPQRASEREPECLRILDELVHIGRDVAVRRL